MLYPHTSSTISKAGPIRRSRVLATMAQRGVRATTGQLTGCH